MRFPHHRMYLSLLREYAWLGRCLHQGAEGRVRKMRVGMLVLRLERKLYDYRR